MKFKVGDYVELPYGWTGYIDQQVDNVVLVDICHPINGMYCRSGQLSMYRTREVKSAKNSRRS